VAHNGGAALLLLTVLTLVQALHPRGVALPHSADAAGLSRARVHYDRGASTRPGVAAVVSVAVALAAVFAGLWVRRGLVRQANR